MSTSRRGQSPILDGYLDELDAATAHLPADEAYEIRDSIAAHIADATGSASRVDDDDARRIVRDLGPVSSIVPLTPQQPSGAVDKPGRAGLVAGGCAIAGLLLIWVPLLGLGLSVFAVLIGVYAFATRQQRGWAVTGILVGLAPIVILLAGMVVVQSTEVHDGPTTSVQYNSP